MHAQILVDNPKEWLWSSACAHIDNKNDTLVNAELLMSIVQKNWTDFLLQKITSEEQQNLQKHERTGRPLGNLTFIEQLEKTLVLKLKPGKPGPKPENKNHVAYSGIK